MPEPHNQTPDSWFHRNPKKTLFFFTLFLILAITFGAEKFLEYRNHRQGIVVSQEVARRYVKLREYRPGSRLLMAFPRDYLPYTDNVFTKKYRLDIDRNQQPDSAIRE